MSDSPAAARQDQMAQEFGIAMRQEASLRIGEMIAGGDDPRDIYLTLAAAATMFAAELVADYWIEDDEPEAFAAAQDMGRALTGMIMNIWMRNPAA